MFNKRKFENISALITDVANTLRDTVNKSIASVILTVNDLYTDFNKLLERFNQYVECSSCGHLVNKQFTKMEEVVGKKNTDELFVDTYGVARFREISCVVEKHTCNTCINKDSVTVTSVWSTAIPSVKGEKTFSGQPKKKTTKKE